MRRVDALIIGLFFILAFFLTADLFFHPGRSVTFDGHVHITTIAQFYSALTDGEFPVRWADGFANYGHPLPIFAHQTTSYVGAFFQVFTHNAVLSYNMVILAGAFLSAVLFYRFMRYYFSPLSAFAGGVLFMFAPYRIVNIYVRGAVPEFFGAVFLPLVLIGVYQFVVQKRKLGLLWVSLGTALLALTHPMMLVISALVIVPYTLYILWPIHKNLLKSLWLGASAVLGLGLAGYYLVPLFLELKYLSYGQSSNRFRGAQGFQTVAQFFQEQWGYFGPNHPGPRLETLRIGYIEIAVTVIVGVLGLYYWKSKKTKELRTLIPWYVACVGCLILLLPISLPLYQYFSPLNNIQYPWRVLSALMFVPAFMLAWFAERWKKSVILVVVCVLVALLRFPQLYGKNFMQYDLINYDFTAANLHTNNMNTLWMGNSRDYPVRSEKAAFIAGEGVIDVVQKRNALRVYKIKANSPSRIVDYTFYFPGWEVVVDGQPTPIEFQDEKYRGVITYSVPEGEHEVSVAFKDTKVRKLGSLVSMVSIATLLGFAVFDRIAVRKRVVHVPVSKHPVS